MKVTSVADYNARIARLKTTHGRPDHLSLFITVAVSNPLGCSSSAASHTCTATTNSGLSPDLNAGRRDELTPLQRVSLPAAAPQTTPLHEGVKKRAQIRVEHCYPVVLA